MSTLRLVGLLLILSLLVLSGCAPMPPKPKEINLPEQSRLLIVSMLGDNVNLQETGTTIFQNWRKTETRNGWQIDQFLNAYIADYLGDDGIFIPVQIDEGFDTGQLGKPERGGFSGAYSLEDGNISLQELATKYRAHGILIVTTAQWGDTIYRTNQHLQNYGVYQRSFFGSQLKNIYTVTAIALFDRNGKEIEQSLSMEYTQSPIEHVSEETKLTQVQWQTLETKIKELLQQAVEKNLNAFVLKRSQIESPAAAAPKPQ